MPKKSTTRLESVLEEIETVLKRQNSLRYIFLQGLTRGLGTALGAAMLVALITTLTINFADNPAVDAFLKSVVQSMFTG